MLKYSENQNVFLNDVISLIDVSRIINFDQLSKNKETGYRAFWNVTCDLGLSDLNDHSPSTIALRKRKVHVIMGVKPGEGGVHCERCSDTERNRRFGTLSCSF